MGKVLLMAYAGKLTTLACVLFIHAWARRQSGVNERGGVRLILLIFYSQSALLNLSVLAFSETARLVWSFAPFGNVA